MCVRECVRESVCVCVGGGEEDTRREAKWNGRHCLTERSSCHDVSIYISILGHH